MDDVVAVESERDNRPNRVRAAIDGTDLGGGNRLICLVEHLRQNGGDGINLLGLDNQRR